MKPALLLLTYFFAAIMYLVLLVLWISIPEELTLNVATTIFTLCLTAALIIVDRSRFRNIYQSTEFSKFINSLITAVLIFLILGMINFFAVKRPVQIDFTKDRINSLTSESIQVVGDLDKPAELLLFARKNENASEMELLNIFRIYKKDLDIELIDGELRPDLVAKYGIDKLPTLVIKYGDKIEVVSVIDELNITNALIKLHNPKQSILCISEGHGELDFNKISVDGGSVIAEIFKKSRFQLLPIKIFSQGIPTECSSLIIWGPKNAFLDSEQVDLSKYLAAGGRLLLALDPNFKQDFFGGIRDIVRNYGLDIRNDLVIDRGSFVNGSDGTVPLVQKIEQEHPITKNLSTPIFFPLTSSINDVSDREDDTARDLSVKLLIKSLPFPASWAENNLNQIIDGKAVFQEGSDSKGPAAMVALAQMKNAGKSTTRIAVFGCSGLVMNSYAKFLNNFALVNNTVIWLTEDNLITSFNLAVGKNEPVFISKPQLGVIFYFSMVLVPLIMLGLSFWFYRRRIRL